MDDRRSPSFFFCCFRCHHDSDDAETKPAYRCLARSSSWLRRRALQLPALKDKCRRLFGTIGKEGVGGMGLNRAGRHAGEFRYDPLSYALNFDDETAHEEPWPPHDFSARFVLAPAAGVKHGQALNCPAMPAVSAIDRG
ncbi:hypothetical protein EJ110_NYTH40922 [Nymphaea thermarum]|nr:hypothetical protein EJ110_NYTH40922 [Nymphaea thermarum]